MALRLLHEQAVREAAGAALSTRARLLANIVAFVEAETRTAFSGIIPEAVPERALALGRTSQKVWGDLLRVMRRGVDGELVEDAYWAARADESRLEGGPLLSREEATGHPGH